MARRHRFAKATAPVAPTIPVILPSPTAAPSVQRVPTTSAAQATEVSAFAEIGATGLKQYSGLVSEEFIQQLYQQRGRAVYLEMMSNHPMIRAGLNTINQHLRQVSIRVERTDDSPQGQQAYDLVSSCLTDMRMSWHDTLSNILTFLPYGWQVSEQCFKRRLGAKPGPAPGADGKSESLPRSKFNDGLIGWDALAPRSQQSVERWDFSTRGTIQGLYQRPAPDYRQRYIPLTKGLLFRTDAINDNPEGTPLTRGAYTSWYRQKHLEFVLSIAIKRDATGFPIAYLPETTMLAASGTAEATVREECEKIVKRICTDEQMGATWPSIFDSNGNRVSSLELLTSPGKRQVEILPVLEYYDQKIAQAMLTDFLLFGHQKIGTQALATSRIEDVYQVALAGWMDAILGILNRYGVRLLLELNGFPLDNPPQFVHGAIGKPDPVVIGQYVQALAAAGMVMFPSPDLALETELMRIGGLPTPEATGERVTKRAGTGTAAVTDTATAMVEAAMELRDELRRARANGHDLQDA